jgi:DNA-binding GntR family transcriptional regulator
LLRRQIEAGELSGHLPSTVALAARHGMSRGTVTRALGVLEQSGVITSSGGRRGFDIVAVPHRAAGGRVHPGSG